tara:strand:+ start:17619 stop:17726 length:108 start_codon:yes stop_codon:yes gene_type:complete
MDIPAVRSMLAIASIPKEVIDRIWEKQKVLGEVTV